MNSLRKILFPFSIVYGFATRIRNWAFDTGLLKSEKFGIPVIAVGNLNVGGTGKSPLIETMIRLLQEHCKTAVLSRGYGRKTKGFLLADEQSNAAQLGDEPFQFYRKFKRVTVAVDEKRARGIKQLLTLRPDLEVVLLDDAFQHRYVNAGLTILLTSWNDLYTDDLLLPAGNLREARRGAKRADMIIVTKCPPKLTPVQKEETIKKLQPESCQEVFFSTISYHNAVIGRDAEIALSDLSKYKVLLVSGIADPKPLEGFLRSAHIDFEHIEFGDHQTLHQSDFNSISKKFDRIAHKLKIILTTEKDYVRNFMEVNLPVFYLPISAEFLEEADKFNHLIKDYVRKNKGDN